MKINLNKISIESIERNVKISLNKDIEIPELTYKYYYFNSNSLNSIKNETIHFGHSFTMNDLMDGNFLLWDFEDFLLDYMKERNLDMNFKEFYHKNLIRTLSRDFLKHVGYFCLRENFHNDLLWTHYTNERGFCVEYNTKELLENFKSLQMYFVPINYDELKQINFKKNSLKTIKNNKVNIEANIPLFYSLVNKEKFWSYEKEWRIIVRDEKFDSVSHPLEFNIEQILEFEYDAIKNRNLKINDNCINRIILSTYFFDNNRFDMSQENGNQIIYKFKNNDGKANLKEFITILMNRYNNKVYQVAKYLENGKVIRNIKYKIEFLRITENYCEIERNFC